MSSINRFFDNLVASTDRPPIDLRSYFCSRLVEIRGINSIVSVGRSVRRHPQLGAVTDTDGSGDPVMDGCVYPFTCHSKGPVLQ